MGRRENAERRQKERMNTHVTRKEMLYQLQRYHVDHVQPLHEWRGHEHQRVVEVQRLVDWFKLPLRVRIWRTLTGRRGAA